MEKISWDESLSVDVDEIDEDHRKLVDLFNMLSQSVADGDSSEYTEAVLAELISFTVWHFRHEERLMLKYSYSDFEAHKAEHKELIDNILVLQRMFANENRLLKEEEMHYLQSWLTGHILGRDMKLGFYLMKKM